MSILMRVCIYPESQCYSTIRDLNTLNSSWPLFCGSSGGPCSPPVRARFLSPLGDLEIFPLWTNPVATCNQCETLLDFEGYLAYLVVILIFWLSWLGATISEKLDTWLVPNVFSLWLYLAKSKDMPPYL